MMNPFWRWVRLREGRVTYKHVIQLDCTDGNVVTVTVEGKSPHHVAAISNSIRHKYDPTFKPAAPNLGSPG